MAKWYGTLDEPLSQAEEHSDNWYLPGQALVIKDIAKLAKMYACVHCHARFTQACSLQRHAQRCAQVKTIIDCQGERVEAPQTAFKKALSKTLHFPRIASVA